MSRIVKLTKGYEAIVDDEDFEELNKYKWHAVIYNKNKPKQIPYAQSTFYLYGKKKNLKMHRVIMNCPKDMQIDHINLNTLDNRKQNLRICTRRQNNFNKRSHKKTGNKYPNSQYKGVTYSFSSGKSKNGNIKIRTKRWHAHISIDKKLISLGYYLTEIEAAKAYDKAAIKHHKDFAKLNFSEEKI